jgi:hypothetical protein
MVRYSKSKTNYLHPGTEVLTDEGRIGVVDTHWSNNHVALRYHEKNWPFPQWDTKTRRQLTPVVVEYEDALM